MTGSTLCDKKKRVWELDALRGALILLVLCNHLNMTVEALLTSDAYPKLSVYRWIDITDPLHFWFDWGSDGVVFASPLIKALRGHLTRPIVDVFFIVSGISCVFSRNNIRSGIRLMAGAAFVSFFTWMLEIVTGDGGQFIRFGVLHCYALCHLLYAFLLKERQSRFLILTAVMSLVVGYYLMFNPVHSDSPLLVPFGIREYNVIHRDYWPVFPMLGWFLIGVVLGKRFYPNKETLFPSCTDRKWHRPLRYLGRHSGLIYCCHMVVYALLFCSIGYIFNLC